MTLLTTSFHHHARFSGEMADRPAFFNISPGKTLPACRRLLFPLLHAEKGRATKEIGDVCTQARENVYVFVFLKKEQTNKKDKTA